MTSGYQRPAVPAAGLRLHLNENTAGCSPRVLAAMRALTAPDVGTYPDTSAAVSACAARLGLPASHVLLTNGLDEALLACSVHAATAAAREGRSWEAIVVEPAFDMYRVFTEAAGGTVAAIAPRPDFELPLADVLGRIGPATRLVFLANPNNPTGRPIARDAIRRVADRSAQAQALVFLDEAYYDFANDTFLGELERHPNVLVGRTFSKAYGLAGLRIGVIAGVPGRLAPLRRIVPPFSLNAFAAAGLAAALADEEHVRRYVAETVESRRLIYEACARLGLDYWPSQANFVLVRSGARTGRLVAGLADRRIYVRDRSQDPGCDGCVRITAGWVADTRACLAALEDILCGAP